MQSWNDPPAVGVICGCGPDCGPNSRIFPTNAKGDIDWHAPVVLGPKIRGPELEQPINPVGGVKAIIPWRGVVLGGVPSGITVKRDAPTRNTDACPEPREGIPVVASTWIGCNVNTCQVMYGGLEMQPLTPRSVLPAMTWSGEGDAGVEMRCTRAA